MAEYEVDYIYKRHGKEYPGVYFVEADTAKEAIRKTREWTQEQQFPHPFRPRAKKLKQN